MNDVNAMYRDKKMTISEVAAQFQSGWSCVSDIALVIPYAIYEEVGKLVADGKLHNMRIHTMLDAFPLGCYQEPFSEKILGISWFTGGYARKGINTGCGDVMPNYYRDMPGLLTRYVDVDAYCAVVSAMDEEGYFYTFDGSNGRALLAKAKHIFLEVNPQMPMVKSSPRIHISQVTALCENEKPLAELAPKDPDPISSTIGGLIAEEIPNRATLQLGIGAIPEAVGRALMNKRDIGIHTEMLTDSMVDMLMAGVATNAYKPIHTGKTVATFAYGTKKMYDFMHLNPDLEMLPVNYTNDPKVIAQHPNMISVNAAVEVDFFGQACAESIGSRHFSGSGGQLDFVRGAVEAPGGKSFIAFPSTAKNGTISKIRPTLAPGSIVTTGKNDIDYVVTEYGVAKLRGKTLRQRTRALIGIAHPNFREELIYEAKKMNILV